MRARVKLSQPVGSSTRYSQLKKIVADSQHIPPEIRGDITAIEQELAQAEYSPPPPLTYAWRCYWDIRRTKTRDFPITHQDILAVQQLMGHQFFTWEVDVILDWDSTFYEVLK